MANQSFLMALGGNLPSEMGPPEATLREALAQLPLMGVTVLSASRLYSTPCFPAGAGPDYVNAAAHVSFAGRPEEFLRVLHRLEAKLGRARQQRWGQRTLDLDVLAAGDLVLPDRATFEAWQGLTLDQQMREAPDQLILPHPRLHERAFVLVPLNDVAPDWRHPVSGLSVAEMLAALPQEARADVKVLD